MSLKNSLRTDFTVRYFFKEITRFYKFSRHAPAKFNLFISALAKKVPAFVSCMYVYTTALDISGSCTYYPTRQIATTTQVSIVYRASITLLPKITRISARFLAIKKKEKKKKKKKSTVLCYIRRVHIPVVNIVYLIVGRTRPRYVWPTCTWHVLRAPGPPWRYNATRRTYLYPYIFNPYIHQAAECDEERKRDMERRRRWNVGGNVKRDRRFSLETLYRIFCVRMRTRHLSAANDGLSKGKSVARVH